MKGFGTSFLLLFFAVLARGAASSSSSSPPSCTKADRAIYEKRGHEFPTLMRSFGGYWVNEHEFAAAVVTHVGLSGPCAACYGASYLCGYKKCFFSCAVQSGACDRCLDEYECVSACKRCTGFN
jgi:hypothetical protein